MNNISIPTLLAVMFLSTACATHTSIQPVIPEAEAVPEDVTMQPESSPVDSPVMPAVIKPAPAPVNIATDSLTSLARAQYQAKQYQSAIATAERGLRIDRRAAALYLLLAQSYVQLDMPQKAINFVQQGLRYTTPDSDTEIGLLRLRDILQQD